MMDLRRSIRSISFITLVLVYTTMGYRRYDSIVESFKCTPANNFFKKMSCNIDKSGALSAYMEFQKEVTDLRIDTSSMLVQKNNDTKELFNLKGIRVCAGFDANPVIQMTKRVLHKYSNLPEKCPIPSNFVFKMENYTFNLDYLPEYLPECRFRIRTHMKNRYTRYLTTEIEGRIVHKRVQMKGRRTSNKV